MVKFTTSVIAAALLSVPAIATSYEQYERSIAESDLYGRDLFYNDDILAVREDLDELFGRELVDDLEERGGGVGALWTLAKGLRRAKSVTGGSGGSNNDNGNSNSNNGNNGGRHRHHWFGRGLDAELDFRDFVEDLEAREPVDLQVLAKGVHAFHSLHKAHKAAKTASQFVPQGGNDDNGNTQRRDLYDEEMFERDFDEFLTREYFDDLD